MSDTPHVTRREAIKTGADVLTVAILALRAAAVPHLQLPPPPPVLPDWLADEPELAAAFERLSRATRHVDLIDPGVTARFVDGWAASLEKLAAQEDVQTTSRS